jgi:hypothetical protein
MPAGYSPLCDTHTLYPYAAGGVGTHVSPAFAHEPWLVSPKHENAMSPHFTIGCAAGWIGAHSSTGVVGATVAEHAPPSHSTAGIASFVVQPPSHPLGGSKGTPASESLGHTGDALTVTLDGGAHVPVDGAQEHGAQDVGV